MLIFLQCILYSTVVDALESNAALPVAESGNEIPITKQTIPEVKNPLLAGLRESKRPAVNPIDDGAVGKMFFGLGCVLAMIFFCSWLLKRFNVNKLGTASSLTVSGVLPIGTKEKVVVVDVEGTRLVLGVTSTNISMLHTLDSVGATPKSGLPSANDSFDPSFSSKMRQILKEGVGSE